MDARTPVDFAKFPKFIVGDDGQERAFVIHCHFPRFIMEFTDGAAMGVAVLIDYPDDVEGYEGAMLMREAADFYAMQKAR